MEFDPKQLKILVHYKNNITTKKAKQDLYTGTETLVTRWFICDRHHNKRNLVIIQSPGVTLQVLVPIAQIGFPLTAAGKLRGDARFPLLSRGFLQPVTLLTSESLVARQP